ncbi:MAG: glycosyltransferase family 2 protein [Chloracidobacterium sp.]|nr:glycosyltransferase family 2 protein [Chloracidobacterium sp.]MDW8217985.1 glycosyltransferase family 2 protein [Acidobacteriota bacterium]
MSVRPECSVVIPVYNEEENLPEIHRRMEAILNQLSPNSEVIFVDDGSRDRSLEIMRDIHTRDARFRYVSLARNFGHQIAVTAGLYYTSGQAVIVMDADLQDPPEVIAAMLQKWREGYHIVYARRRRRKQERWLKRFLAYWFYRVIRILAEVDIPPDTGDFCLMDRRVVDILNAMPERNRYLRGLRAWVGFRQTEVAYDREPRFAGEVKYTFRKSFALAVNGIVSLSRAPLRLATYFGLSAAGLAMLMVALVIYWRIYYPSPTLVGYAIITAAIFFFGAVQLICLGILGEYIGRIYEEVKGRPLFTVQEVGGVLSTSHEPLRQSHAATRNV